MPESAAPELSQYLSYILIFSLCLVLLGTVGGILHRIVSRSPLSFYNRIAGGVFGFATGWLIVMTMLTALHMATGATGIGVSLADAAAQSRSQRFSDEMLARTSKILPQQWREFTDEWRGLLRGEQVADPAGLLETSGPGPNANSAR